MQPIIIGMITAFLAAVILAPIAAKLSFKVGAVDAPNERKVHSRIMPRLGGLAIYCGFMAGFIVSGSLRPQVYGLALAASVVFLTGFLDDLKGLTPLQKLAGQFVAAIVFVAFGNVIGFLTNPFTGGIIDLGIFGIPITIIWLVGISNAVNLIDGLDGLAGGVSAISAFTIGIIGLLNQDIVLAVIAMYLTMATCGFLVHNFPPAKLFMGDCGALFLGFMLAALSVMGLSKGATLITLILPIVILGVPIMDTSFAIIRRARNKKPIFAADKGHLHHILLQKGYSTRKAVLIIYGLTLFLSFSAILMVVLTSAQAMIVLAVVAIVVLFLANQLGVFSLHKKVAVKKESTGLRENKLH